MFQNDRHFPPSSERRAVGWSCGRPNVNGAAEIIRWVDAGAQQIPTGMEKAVSNSLPDEEGAMPDEDGILPGQDVDPDLGPDTGRVGAANDDGEQDDEKDVDLDELP